MTALAQNVEHIVRQRAHELWVERGTPEGYDEEFWLQAEREVKAVATGETENTNSPTAHSGGGSDGPG